MDMAFGKKHYSVYEAYRVFYNGLRTFRYMARAKRKKELSPEFIERMMLAVTEVNGCWVCSYVHTKVALEMGMSHDEIRKMLAGTVDDVPVDEAPAVMFAQHYADTKGNPTKEAWHRVVEIYGPSKAVGLLGAIRAIMVGNVHGIAWTALVSRLRGEPDPRSSLLYEAAMLMAVVVFLPVSLVHAAFAGVLGMPIIDFK